MSKKFPTLALAGLILVLILAACSNPLSRFTKQAKPAKPTKNAPTVALKLTGLVDKELKWTEAELHAMKTTQAVGQNSTGQNDTYTGVAVVDLLKLAGVKAEAQNVTFVAGDGTKVDFPLADIQGCPTCIASFRTNGGLSLVLPGHTPSMPVKGLQEIKVK